MPRLPGLLLVAALLNVPGPSALAAGVSKEKLNETVKKLQANAEKWLKGEEIDKSVDRQLGGIAFDKESVAHLQVFLKSAKRDAAGLYVVNKLLGRLEKADVETIRTALPDVKNLHSRTRNAYRSFPKVSRGQIASLKLPTYSSRLTTDAIMGRMAALDKQRDVKVARDIPLAKHNEMVYELAKKAIRLMCMAGDARDDTYLARNLFLEERKGDAIFATIADELGAHARKMDPQRATKLYAMFRPHVSRLAMQNRKSYVCRGKSTINRTQTSTYGKADEYAGIKVLGTMNKIADAAKNKAAPRVKVPTRQQIEEYHKKRAAARK